MEIDSFPKDPSNLTQLKKYARDLARVYRSEKEKRKELEAVYQELEKYARDFTRLYKSEKEKRLDIETASQEVQKMYIPLERDGSGEKGTTAKEQNEHIEFFGYYKGAKGVSGDYFDYKRIDDKHYAVIKCDVAGKGVPAALIMVQIATVFDCFFRNWTTKEPGYKINDLVYQINDMLVERDFKGRFAALILGIINIESGDGYYCNAGDNILHFYNSSQGRIKTARLPEAPVVGVFPSELVKLKAGFKIVSYKLNVGDTLFFFTDGLDEAKRFFRNEQLQILTCNKTGPKEDGGYGDTYFKGSDNEKLGISRIHQIINNVFNRGSFRLVRHYMPDPGEEFTFSFSDCRGSLEELVLALVAVEKVFRLYRDSNAGGSDRVVIDKKIDEFLKMHFSKYRLYFANAVKGLDKLSVRTYSHIKEDEQYDDLTILAIRKR